MTRVRLVPPLVGGICSRDGNPAPGESYLCDGCRELLAELLAAAAELFVDLEVSLAKQARISEDDGPRMAGNPLPYSVAASDALAELRRVLLPFWPATSRARYAALTRDEQPRRLEVYVRMLSGLESAVGLVDELLVAVEAGTAVVDRPASLVYLGVCWAWAEEGWQCPAELYAASGAGVVVCSTCRTSHDANARRAWLLEVAENETLNATELARAVSGLGANVTPGRIHVWAHRGRIESVGRDARNRPLYRVGDVTDVLRADISTTNKSA